jgi:hypothetical protein
VWLEDLTAVELKAAVDAGKTVAIVYGSGTHEGAEVVLGNLFFGVLAERRRAGGQRDRAAHLTVLPGFPAAIP